jgi:stress-induced morphogen
MLLKGVIEAKLNAALPVASLVIQDKSYMHVGHAENLSTGQAAQETHLHIIIKSSRFNNLDTLARHKILYNILKDEIAKLHAISIEAIEDI